MAQPGSELAAIGASDSQTLSNVGLGAIYAAMLVLCCAGGEVPQDRTLALSLAGLGAVLEAVAPRLPRFGFLSSSFPCYFALAVLPNGSPAVAALVAATLLLARALLRGGSRVWWSEMLVDGVPTMGALLVARIARERLPFMVEGFPASLPATVGGLATFLVLGHLLPGVLAQELKMGRGTRKSLAGVLGLQMRAGAMFGPVLVILAAHGPWHILWTVPVFLGMHQFVWERLQEVRRAKSRQRETTHALERTEQRLENTERSLEYTAEGKALVENCARAFARSRGLEETCREIVKLGRSLYPGTSAAVFLIQDESLRVAYHEGKADLSRPPGPIVERSWKSQAPTMLQPGEATLFAEDRRALALPLHPMGVLYLGDDRISPETSVIPRLCLLADQASLGLQSAVRQQRLEQALQELKESQAQLMQSSKMAAVGQLAAGVAHEINTPLGAALLAMQSAVKGLQKQKYDRLEKKLEQSQRGVQKAKDIVSKMLYYSRQSQAEDAPVNLAQVAGDTFEFLASQIEVEGVEVQAELGETPPVIGNQNELQQVVTNLLINARDAARASRERRLRLLTGCRGDEVWLAVVDTGVGMDSETQERMFEPFFTSKPVGEGTGLGLYVSRQIIERHRGRFEVDSQCGRGTRVTVFLPLS